MLFAGQPARLRVLRVPRQRGFQRFRPCSIHGGTISGCAGMLCRSTKPQWGSGRFNSQHSFTRADRNHYGSGWNSVARAQFTCGVRRRSSGFMRNAVRRVRQGPGWRETLRDPTRVFQQASRLRGQALVVGEDLSPTRRICPGLHVFRHDKRRAIVPREHPRSLFISGAGVSVGVKMQFTAQAVRNIRKVNQYS